MHVPYLGEGTRGRPREATRPGYALRRRRVRRSRDEPPGWGGLCGYGRAARDTRLRSCAHRFYFVPYRVCDEHSGLLACRAPRKVIQSYTVSAMIKDDLHRYSVDDVRFDSQHQSLSFVARASSRSSHVEYISPHPGLLHQTIFEFSFTLKMCSHRGLGIGLSPSFLVTSIYQRYAPETSGTSFAYNSVVQFLNSLRVPATDMLEHVGLYRRSRGLFRAQISRSRNPG